jgi:two-component system response regulator RegA
MKSTLRMGVTPSLKNRLLLVDDDELYRRSLSRALGGAGFDVREARDLRSAREVLQALQVSVAVIDLRLDDQSGLDVLRDLLAAHPGLRCVVVTGYLSSAIAVDAIRLGAVDCVPKSLGIDALVAAIAGERAAPSADVPVPSLAQVEWDHINRVVRDCGGNLTRAAHKLGIHRQSLQRKLRQHAPRR